MPARGYELDDAVRSLQEAVRKLDLKTARTKAATGTGSDPGTTGIPGSPTDVEAALAALQAEIDGLLPSSTIVQEADGTPSVSALEIVVPNDTLDVAGGAATLNYMGSRGGGRATLDTRSVSGAITLDLGAFNAFHLTLTGNVTSVTFSNPPPSGVDATWPMALVQGGSGSYTWAWPASAKFRAADGTNTGSAPALSTAVGAQDDFDLSTSDGGTTYGVTPGAVSMAFATPTIALGTAAAAGAAATTIRSDSTIVAFDATVPTTGAFGDSAATGSAAVAARRDHRHGMPASGASATDTGIWRPVMDPGTGGIIVDGTTGEALMGFGPA